MSSLWNSIVSSESSVWGLSFFSSPLVFALQTTSSCYLRDHDPRAGAPHSDMVTWQHQDHGRQEGEALILMQFPWLQVLRHADVY